MRKAAGFFLLGALPCFSLTFDEIKANLARNPRHDTLESKVEITVSADSFAMTSQTHVYLKGKDKMWMETTLPGGKVQKMIRNGSRMRMTNPITGQEQLLPFQGNQFQNPLDYAQTAFDGGRLVELKQDKGQYRITLRYEMDSPYERQSFVYDPVINQVIAMESQRRDGTSASTAIQYCSPCSWKAPKRIEIVSAMQGKTARVVIDFQVMRALASVPEAMFRVE